MTGIAYSMIKDAYRAFMLDTNIEGSGKASSYFRALNLLSQMLTQRPEEFADCIDIWNSPSIDRLEVLRQRVLVEQKKGDDSVWSIAGLPRSYLSNGYCSAALKSYQRFLVEYLYEQKLLKTFHQHTGDASTLAGKLDQELSIPDFMQQNHRDLVGKDAVRTVKVRTNQNVFRSMILENYQQRCCITGLDIPALNKASHIVPWARDAGNRLNPANGLCLSATYDVAFDRNLISLDDDYRVILSRDIKEYFSSLSVTEYFLKKEGLKIRLPYQYKPDKALLEQHRAQGQF